MKKNGNGKTITDKYVFGLTLIILKWIQKLLAILVFVLFVTDKLPCVFVNNIFVLFCVFRCLRNKWNAACY